MNKSIDVSLKSKIHNIRGFQVMLDSDLAFLYGVSTKRLNEQVRRNIDRFPEDFMFKLSESEYDILRSQFATSSWGGARKLPYAFTEQGVAMLSGILRSKKAVEVNIRIMRAFVHMRRMLLQNHDILLHLNKKIIEHDDNFEKVFKIIEERQQLPSQGIFFEGKTFDAFKFIFDLIETAKKRIILIDNYVNYETLYFFSKIKVDVNIFSTNISSMELEKYNAQYHNVRIIDFNLSHDRFLIIDDNVYLIGASLKDAGKKWFGFSRINDANSVLERVGDYL